MREYKKTHPETRLSSLFKFIVSYPSKGEGSIARFAQNDILKARIA